MGCLCVLEGPIQSLKVEEGGANFTTRYPASSLDNPTPNYRELSMTRNVP